MIGYKIWHKDLIPVLPSKLLFILYQNLANYSLNPVVPKSVNPYKYKLSLFNKSHFFNYCCEVYNELSKRLMDEATRWGVDEYSEVIRVYVSDEEKQIGSSITHEELFDSWHNDRYLKQCYYTLEEMYDYELINSVEFERIKEKFKMGE